MVFNSYNGRLNCAVPVNNPTGIAPKRPNSAVVGAFSGNLGIDHLAPAVSHTIIRTSNILPNTFSWFVVFIISFLIAILIYCIAFTYVKTFNKRLILVSIVHFQCLVLQVALHYNFSSSPEPQKIKDCSLHYPTIMQMIFAGGKFAPVKYNQQ